MRPYLKIATAAEVIMQGIPADISNTSCYEQFIKT